MAGVPPLKNSAYTTNVSLVSQADTDVFKASPTLAAGDVKVSKDGGTLDNIGSLPSVAGTVSPNTYLLNLALTADEMNADRIAVLFHDAAGDEWQDLLVTIDTDTVQLNDVVLPTITDSVPADGSLPTVNQALYMIWQFLSEKSVSGTTVTVKKADGSTSLMTFTLDDATTPNSITRAS